MSYKIIDNFMDIEYFYPLQALMFDKTMPWYLEKNFSHTFYIRDNILSNLYTNLIPTVTHLNAKALVDIKANLFLKEKEPTCSEWECSKPFKCKSAIYYLNNSNGETHLQIDNKEIKIEAKENRMLIFDSEIKYRNLNQTDLRERIEINYNYYD